MSDQNTLKDSIDSAKLPGHIAIIMDGNGRWAKNKGQARVFGHRKGVKAVREVTEACAEIGVKYLTLYAFSTENWRRPRFEISALMELLVRTIRKETETLQKNHIRLRSIGKVDHLPERCQNELAEAIELTKNNKRMDLILALSYSGRTELTDAAKRLAIEVQAGRLKPEDIEPETMNNFLYTHNIPDPELLIRSSGEQRISNFLLWQLAYTELYFTDTFWPEFRKDDLYKAILDFQHRERRFGKTSEQMTSLTESEQT